MFGRPRPDAARIVPEVIQTSMMDCGPASLMALMQGFGVPVSFGRLREVCQTTVDGTSISTMDEVANLLGLETEEISVPPDHVLIPESGCLPAIAVVLNETGASHFLVVWSVAGPWVQVMDPAHGRRWISRQALEEKLYQHTSQVPAAEWRTWAESPEAQGALGSRLQALGIARQHAGALRGQALAVDGWRGLAALDAACRMTLDLIRARAIRRGRESSRLVTELFAYGCDPGQEARIPRIYWSVLPAPDSDPDDPEELSFRGAVLVRSRGRRKEGPDREALSDELAAALDEDRPRPGRTLLAMLAQDGLTTPLVLLGAAVTAAALVLFEGLLLRGFLELGHQLGLATHRAAAISIFAMLLALALAIQLPIVRGAMTMGRALEARLRVAFLSKIPRLSDRYFHSRLISDMAERCHGLHRLRYLPILGTRFLDGCAQIVFMVAGIAWLEPRIAPWALLVALVSIGLPLALQPVLLERDLRLRTHMGALLHFYLDALVGLIPIRVHGAQQSMAREQEGRMVDWSRAAMRFHATGTWVEGVLALAGFGVAVLMVSRMSQSHLGSALLVVYWALSLPMLGQRIAVIAREYPALHSIALRVLEPLGAREEEGATPGPGEHQDASQPVGISIAGVTVEAGGHVILRDLDLTVKPGEHVAIVGPSGAGKSSLVGLLLGWHRPKRGRLEVDGRPLTGARLSALRRATAWVDPAVQLWNAPMLDNLLYGAELAQDKPIASVLHDAELRAVLERLPDGMQTRLGEGGGLVSGGEGQRVRLGRALMHQDARLVILDEAFRGLDRSARRRLTARARVWWKHATLLLVSHDIEETRDFERVLVIEDGRVVEDGAPAALLRDQGSRYSALVAGDRAMRTGEWAGGEWRRLWLEDGRLREEESP
jgi:ABC-type bacteriocin/lantibiotic exporter with double-glycine peptidase domain